MSFYNLKVANISNVNIDIEPEGVYLEAKVTLTNGKDNFINEVKGSIAKVNNYILTGIENRAQFPSEDKPSDLIDFHTYYDEEPFNTRHLKSFLMNEDLDFCENNQASNYIPVLFQALSKQSQDLFWIN